MAVALRVLRGGKAAKEEADIEAIVVFDENHKRAMRAYELVQDMESDYTVPGRRVRDIRWRQVEIALAQIATSAAGAAAEIRELRGLGGGAA